MTSEWTLSGCPYQCFTVSAQTDLSKLFVSVTLEGHRDMSTTINQTCKRMNEWVGGWMDGKTDGQTEE